MDTFTILERYFYGKALEVVAVHSRAVSRLAVDICRVAGLDADETLFVEQAAMLHDIGVCYVNAPELGLSGEYEYIRHGILGREILEAEGLHRHAMVCERHIGVGLTVDDVILQGLDLPHRDMLPCDPAEEIVCFADLFYSKKPQRLEVRKSVEDVRRSIGRFGAGKLQVFDSWMQRFGQAL